ncbi:MAG: hypothetical protein GVY36_04225 [Verrucomicrobia bacterium]|jgi:hypothetical protein|nr:hypothetical protein [Verrucomicrobiota bacterium]
MKQLKFIILLLIFVHVSRGSSDWVQGGVLIHELSGGVNISELGEAELKQEISEFPVGIHGRLSCRADSGAHAVLSASNRMFLQFRGPGEFGVERFEQTEPEQDAWLSSEEENGLSRLLISFRSGHMLIDARSLNGDSRVTVETPLGRITSSRALWQMRIAFDQRSEIFDFEIACSSGRLNFTDKRDLKYALRAGQRLSGAGGWMTPGIDIVETTEKDREAIGDFLSICDGFQAVASRLNLYLPLMKQLPDLQTEQWDMPAADPGREDTTPVIIEYAPRPESLTPFRGEIRAPSARQVGVF